MTQRNSKEKFNKVLQDLANNHAPSSKRTITIRHDTPWFNADIKAAKLWRRQLEKQWRKSHLETDHEVFKAQRTLVNIKIEQAKTRYYKEAIKSCNNQKEVYQVTNKLLYKGKVSSLPSHTSVEELANRFADFFTDKIVKIRRVLGSDVFTQDTPDSNIETPSNTSKPPELSSFEPASQEEILKLIKESASKSCSLDPIPTWLLKECQEVLLPVITHIVNLSLSTSTMPSELKEALISPIVKKALLDSEILKNFRPLSNLAFLSKLIEKVVAVRFTNHLQINNLCENMQSAYRKFHSTETALLRVQNDILQAIDSEGAAILVLLDLSAAFDTIDHKILLSTLTTEFGITGNALSWFDSYLSDRYQSVTINGVSSQKHKLQFGVPQGSVLGPLLFTAYTKPLGRIIKECGLQYHLYADDTQLYLAFKPTEGAAQVALEQIQKCVKKIKDWMAENFLKLNDDKTEVLVITKNTNLSKNINNQLSPIQIGESVVDPKENVRNLGVIFDSVCSSEKHVSNICKSTYYQIRNIGLVRRYLDIESTKTLVHAYVTSRLDYCNSLLYGIPKELIQKLQRVQNTAARLITKSKKYDHITPVLKKLHWLPIEQRIVYKVLLLVYKALHDQAPQYLKELLVLYSPSRDLRSKDKFLLDDVTTRYKKYGDRTFGKAAYLLWNKLPAEIRLLPSVESFKSQLKTHLFKQAYN